MSVVKSGPINTERYPELLRDILVEDSECVKRDDFGDRAKLTVQPCPGRSRRRIKLSIETIVIIILFKAYRAPLLY